MSELEVSVATFLPTQPTQTNNTGTAGPYAISFTTYSQCNNVSFSFQSTEGVYTVCREKSQFNILPK